MVVAGVLRGLRYLDSQPPPRTDHVEACRPQGLCSLSIVESTGGPDAELRRGGDRRRAGRRGGGGAAGRARAGASRSSRTGSSAASARSGRACRRRRCCGPYEALAEARRIPGAARGGDRRARRRRPCSTAATRSSTTSTTPRQLPWLEDRGIALIRGRGRLTGERRVRVGDEELEARRAVILATGSLPTMPPIEGLDAIDDAWTNREATTAKEIPERLRDHRRRRGRRRDGAGVPDARRAGHADRGRAAAAPARGGVRVRAGHRGARRATASTSAPGRRPTRVEQRDGDGHRHDVRRRRARSGDMLLVALGRTPQTEDLGLETRRARAGRATSRSTRTCASPATRGCTRSATSTAARCSRTWASTRRGSPPTTCSATTPRSRTAPTARSSPRVIFTEPQVAAVGHTTETARDGRAGRRHRRDDDVRQRRRLVLRPQRARHDALARRPRAPDRRRRDDHGRRGRRLPARGDDRDRRRGAARAPAPRGPVLPDAQRDLAHAAGGRGR